MNTKVLLLLAVVAVAAADKLPTSYGAPPASSEEHEPAKYEFEWSVEDEESGNDFGHQESRDGDDTQGSYYAHLPDGRRQTVTYYVEGDSGYVADVKYEGEAQYPESDESSGYIPPSPIYLSRASHESQESDSPSHHASEESLESDPSPPVSAPVSEEESEEIQAPISLYTIP